MHINSKTVSFSKQQAKQFSKASSDDYEYYLETLNPTNRYAKTSEEEQINPQPKFRGIKKAPKCKKLRNNH